MNAESESHKRKIVVIYEKLEVFIFYVVCYYDEIGGRDTLVGKWQCTWSEGYEKYANNPEYNDEWNEEGDFTVTFNEDGTVVADGDTGKWKLEGDKLTIIYAYDDDSEDNEVYTVLKLTDSELILESSEKDSDYEYYDKSTFQKI